MAKTPASTLLRRLKDVRLIQVPVETFLQRVKLVSLTYVPVGTQLRRLKLVGFIYVAVGRRDDDTAWSRTLILVIKMDQFYLGTRQYAFSASPVVQSHQGISQCVAKSLKDVDLIQVLVVMSLRRFELVSLSQVSISTSLRRLKLVSFISVPMRRRKDV